MGWIKCIDCEKLQRDFVAQTFALIAPVLSVLQQVSCNYETNPNAPKYYKMDWSISLGPMGQIGCVFCEKIPTCLGSNGVDQVRWLRKMTTWHRATDFCIICTSSVWFATISCSYETIPNAQKYYEMDWSISLLSNGADWVCFLRKNPDVTSWHELLY